MDLEKREELRREILREIAKSEEKSEGVDDLERLGWIERIWKGKCAGEALFVGSLEVFCGEIGNLLDLRRNISISFIRSGGGNDYIELCETYRINCNIRCSSLLLSVLLKELFGWSLASG